MVAHDTSATTSQLLRDPAVRRMGAFLVTSVAVHLMLIGMTGRTALRHSQLPLVLQVQLREVVPIKPVALVLEGENAVEFDPPMALPEKPVEAVPAVTVQQPVDTQRMLNLPADIYYANSEVDVRAEPLEEVNLIYPLIPLQERLGGSVTLGIFVNERGGIDKAIVVESKPPGVFDEAALQAVANLKFTPAIKNGKPVKNRKTVAIKFDPYEKINTP